MQHLLIGLGLIVCSITMFWIALPAKDGTPARFLSAHSAPFYAVAAVGALLTGSAYFVSGVVSIL